jgi:hypothetical protein
MRTGMGCALALIVLSSLACHTTRTVTLDMAPATNRVWVTLTDQTVTLLYGPKIFGAKLVGFVSGKYQEFPIAEVKEVQVREPARGRTLALVAVGVAVFAGALYKTAGNLHSASDTHITDICDEDPENAICTM